MKKMITLGTLVAMAVLVLFSGVAEADIDGVPGDKTTSGVETLNGVHTIDGGSHWTHNTDLLKLGNRTTATLTISGGGWLEVTAASVGDRNMALQVGNQGGGVAHLVVTGTGSKATTLALLQVARNESGGTLTIDDGGLVMAQGVTLSADGTGGGSGSFLRMGLGGILAIEGTGKTATGDFWAGTGEMQYDTGSGWANITGAPGGTYTIADETGALTGYSVLTMAGGTTSTPGTMIFAQ